jgi:Protein of unknown function (DUF4232)
VLVAAVALLAGCTSDGSIERNPRSRNIPTAAVASTSATVPWREVERRSSRLPPFPGTIRARHVPWCKADDVRLRLLGYNLAQEGVQVAELRLRIVGPHACGVEGYPTAVGLSGDGTPIASSTRSVQHFEAHPWVELRPGGLPALSVVSVGPGTAPGTSDACTEPTITSVAIHLGHHGGALRVSGPPVRRASYGLSTDYWSSPGHDTFTPDQTLDVSLHHVQRTVTAGSVEHFTIRFTGRNVRALLHPCLPVEITLSPQGPPTLAEVHTLLNCQSVPHRALTSIAFRMQIKVPRHAPHKLWVDVEWPMAIDGIYDILDDGQFLPITINRRAPGR